MNVVHRFAEFAIVSVISFVCLIALSLFTGKGFDACMIYSNFITESSLIFGVCFTYVRHLMKKMKIHGVHNN